MKNLFSGLILMTASAFSLVSAGEEFIHDWSRVYALDASGADGASGIESETYKAAHQNK